jgi:hypothetical protein
VVLRRDAIALLEVVALALSFGILMGCQKKEEQKVSLRGAVYAKTLPIYPSAVYEDAMGGTYSETIGGPATFESLSWFFKVSDPAEKVVEFYRTRLSGASEGKWEDGDPKFTVVPTGAEEGEEVVVTIRPGTLQITEVVKPGKRKD